MTAKFSFNNPPLDNIAFLMSKKPEIHFDYDEIKFEAHQRAFTVAKITQIDLLADIQTSLENAFVDGQSFEKWKKELKPTLQKHGWLGKVVVQNPNTKEQKEIFVGASRLKKIFYTNARTAYAQSEARAGYKLPLSEYIRYVAILDNRTRHTHAQMHGKIAHRKDKFWEKNYPPNGWNCRCRVDSYSKDDLDEFGFKESVSAQKLNIAEKDWDYDTRNLEKNDNGLQLIIENKLKRLAKNQSAVNALNALKAEIKAKRQRYEAIKELWNKQKGTKNDKITLGRVSEFIKNILKDKGYPLNADELVLTWQTIENHRNTRITKTNTHSEIGAFEYSLIPYMLDKNSVWGIFKDANGLNDEISVVVSKLDFQFRLALRDKDGIVKISSLTSNEMSGNDIYERMKKSVKKVKIWTKDEIR